MTRVNRHSLYYRIIDIAFAGQVLMLGALIVKASTGYVVDMPGTLQIPYSAFGLFCILAPPLLIFQRWMRDDFSEMLWQRTAGTVLKLLVILPVPVAIGAGVTFAFSGDTTEVIDRAMRMRNELDPRINAYMQGIVSAAVYLWLTVPVLFTFVFQWHRWRASR
jgi:hypothetical protein